MNYILKKQLLVKIVRAIDKKKDEVYIPAFWWAVMMAIKIIPNSVFKRQGKR